MSELPRITDFFVCTDYCSRCQGTGFVCESHPERPWGPVLSAEPIPWVEVAEDGGCWCGAPGMPCRPDLRSGDQTNLFQEEFVSIDRSGGEAWVWE